MNIHAAHPRDVEDAPRVAISWLAERHRKGWNSAFESLLELWRPEGLGDKWPQRQGGADMLAVNVSEWLLARGEIHARGGLRDINAYLLGHEGPFFTPAQRDWIAQLAQRPLRLYRVTDVQPGAGMTLLDELDPQAPAQSVREVSGSRTLQPGMLMGVRIMAVAAGAGLGAHLMLSGAHYLFSERGEAAVLARARQALTDAADFKLHPDNVRDMLELEIARAWLDQWFAPAAPPQLLNASSDGPLLIVDDHYRVRDAAALAASLAAHPDVEGDAKQGWSRLSQATDGALPRMSTIIPGRNSNRVQLIHHTLPAADEGRTWFEGVAGAAVQHLTREITDLAKRTDPA